MTIPRRNPAFADTSYDGLREIIDRAGDTAYQGLQAMCDAMTEIKARGQSHELTRSGVFRYHQGISEGTLTPKVALGLNAKPDVPETITEYKHKTQNALADLSYTVMCTNLRAD